MGNVLFSWFSALGSVKHFLKHFMVFHIVDLFHNFDSVLVAQFWIQYFDEVDNSPFLIPPKLSKIIPFLVIINFYLTQMFQHWPTCFFGMKFRRKFMVTSSVNLIINRLTVSFEVDHTSFRIAWGSIIDFSSTKNLCLMKMRF